MTALTADLRARILEALNTAPASFVRDDPESAAAHASRPWRRHDRHHYDGGCALCRGEADTLTDAVMAVVQLALADGTNAPRGDWSAAWAELNGYVQEACADGGMIDPADLRSFMVELKRKALAPVREWMAALGPASEA